MSRSYTTARRFYSVDSEDDSGPSAKIRSVPQSLSNIPAGESSEPPEPIDNPAEVRNELTKSFVKEITVARNYLKSLRRWEYTQLGKLIGNGNDQRSIGDGSRFFVMSYNILSQHLLTMHNNLYSGCDPRALNHNFRKQLFFSELEEIQPDILCLQEVEESDFYKVHEPTLFLKGYKGIYKKRTGDKQDGCAIFYKATRFSFVDKLSVEYFQPHIPLLNRDNVGLLIKLRTNKFGAGRKHTFVVGTTHILFNPKRQDVKLAQMQLLLAELDRFAFCGLDPKGQAKYHPIILTGDFNAEPHNQLMRFFSDGFLRTELPSSNSFSFREKAIDNFIPIHTGINDQSQHYKLVLERIKQWKTHRRNEFQLDSKVYSSLVNLYASDSCPSDLEMTTEAAVDSDEFLPRTTTPFVEKSRNKLISRSVTFSDDVDPDVAGPSALFQSFSKTESVSGPDVSAVNLHTQVDPDEHAKLIEEIVKTGTRCSFGSGEISHNLRLNSVYAPPLDRGESGDTACTTKQSCWTTVDYMFYSKIWNEQYKKQTEGKLRLLRRLGLLNRNQCKEMGPIPNLAVSSDHYSLIAEFVLK
ncbi:unnamed protein product [Allacma fusca]|uniref:Endonuclease/exonuclease/phosphatase domain-containing protein n=1 Tax=Allacma fusca TaxID=39272 RepID=A0A8J2PZX9_9HEXA|nr:unnamed protein product [Allacma fusca]